MITKENDPLVHYDGKRCISGVKLRKSKNFDLNDHNDDKNDFCCLIGRY